MRGRPTGPYLSQDVDELRAVRSPAHGQDERQRAALAVGGEVDLAGLPASGALEEGGLQPELSSAPDASSVFPRDIGLGFLPGLFSGSVPELAFPSSVAAFSRAVMTFLPRCIPAASGGLGRWWSRC